MFSLTVFGLYRVNTACWNLTFNLSVFLVVLSESWDGSKKKEAFYSLNFSFRDICYVHSSCNSSHVYNLQGQFLIYQKVVFNQVYTM